MKTLAWAEELHSISPKALDFIRRVLLLPSERLINPKVTKSRRVLSDTLQDSHRICELIALLEKLRPANLADDRTIIPAVDAVAFRPNVTITEEDEVHGLKNLKCLDDLTLFTELLKDPPDFAEFLQDHWKKTHSNLFAFHIQSVNPAFPCSIIHVYPAENGKGNPQTVEKLLALKNTLQTE